MTELIKGIREDKLGVWMYYRGDVALHTGLWFKNSSGDKFLAIYGDGDEYIHSLHEDDVLYFWKYIGRL